MMFMKSLNKLKDQKKPNTDISYINEPNFGHIYSVFSLILEDDIKMQVVGFVPNENRKVF